MSNFKQKYRHAVINISMGLIDKMSPGSKSGKMSIMYAYTFSSDISSWCFGSIVFQKSQSRKPYSTKRHRTPPVGHSDGNCVSVAIDIYCLLLVKSTGWGKAGVQL